MITFDYLWCGSREYNYIGEYYENKDHNSVGGVSVYAGIRNNGDKTIKYVHFNVFPLNAVNDAVACTVDGSSAQTLTMTGPLEPGQVKTSMVWENLWYNYSIKTIKLNWIRIEYMDGTTEESTELVWTPKEDKSGCYVATCVYGSYDCPEVWMLRRFRDYTLAQSSLGRAFIKIYYAVSPTLVKWFGKTTWFKKFWKTPLDTLVNKLQKAGVSSEAYVDKDW